MTEIFLMGQLYCFIPEKTGFLFFKGARFLKDLATVEKLFVREDTDNLILSMLCW